MSFLKPITILAIDPGKDGSAAKLLVTNEIVLDRVLSFKYDDNWETDLFRWCLDQPDVVVMENVHSMPGQGVTSMMTFGDARGSARTAVKIAGQNIMTVEPQTWQRKLGLPHNYNIPDKDKRRAVGRNDQKARALKEFPHLAVIAIRVSVGPKGRKTNVMADVFGSVLIGLAEAIGYLQP